MTYKVTITGFGGTLHGPMHLIQQALENAGCKVTVVDDYPATAEVTQKVLDSKVLSGAKVLLSAKHLPWGG